MRRTPVISLALAALLWAPTAASAAPARATAPGALAHLQATGRLDASTAAADLAIYTSARTTARRLSGVRADELRAVLAATRALAAKDLLTPSRLPAVFLTLRRNRDWWASHPLPATGQRERLGASQLLWQYYPGQGFQIQWLGTFGRANGLWQEGGHDAELGRLLDEAIALATHRAGGLAWEYEFSFDGGAPPWVSGLAQGTALTALARAAARLHRPAYLDAAHQALGIFQTAPPAGVRVPTPAGAHYLQYSYAPTLHIVNGFTQSLNGLWDLATLGHDAAAATLFAAGERQLRVELPTFDTGAWSLYARTAGRPGGGRGAESTLGYHVLLRDFLRNLCARLTAGRRAAHAAPQPAGEPGTGGTPAQSETPATTTIAGDPSPALYCHEANAFTADLHTLPRLVLAPARWRARRTGHVTFTLSKMSTVTVTVARSGRVVLTRTLTVGRGRHALAVRPATAGPLGVTVGATDLAGNSGATQATVHVAPAPREHRSHTHAHH